MSAAKKFLHAWLPVMTAFLLGATFVGIAFAATTTFDGTVKADNFVYAKAKTVQYVVPGSAFVGDSSVNPDHGNYSGAVTIAPSEVVVAPVYLPQGAVVTKVSIYTDITAGGDFELHLEANNSTGGHSDMVSMSPGACATTPCVATTTSVDPSVVNNKTRSYGLWVSDGGSGSTIYRVVITYTTKAVGPVSARIPADAKWSGPAGSNG